MRRNICRVQINLFYVYYTVSHRKNEKTRSSTFASTCSQMTVNIKFEFQRRNIIIASVLYYTQHINTGVSVFITPNIRWEFVSCIWVYNSCVAKILHENFYTNSTAVLYHELKYLRWRKRCFIVFVMTIDIRELMDLIET